MLPLAVYRVSGDSMAPEIRERDYVVVNKLSFLLRGPRVGDVVVSRHPTTHKPIVKRVAEVVEGRYILRGDNERESSDSRTFGPVQRRLLLGKVWRVIRQN